MPRKTSSRAFSSSSAKKCSSTSSRLTSTAFTSTGRPKGMPKKCACLIIRSVKRRSCSSLATALLETAQRFGGARASLKRSTGASENADWRPPEEEQEEAGELKFEWLLVTVELGVPKGVLPRPRELPPLKGPLGNRRLGRPRLKGAVKEWLGGPCFEKSPPPGLLSSSLFLLLSHGLVLATADAAAVAGRAGAAPSTNGEI
ncbi:hypothetical protein TYRP_010351 [Tyrophagus putrescentiae]|nr:hypothetical protein TYRP_010351 [Tyrophagus putrescentiae]